MFPDSSHPVFHLLPSKPGPPSEPCSIWRWLATWGPTPTASTAPGPQFTHLSGGRSCSWLPHPGCQAPRWVSPNLRSPKSPSRTCLGHRTTPSSSCLAAYPPPPAWPGRLKGSNPSPPPLRQDYRHPSTRAHSYPRLRPRSSQPASEQPFPRRRGPRPLARQTRTSRPHPPTLRAAVPVSRPPHLGDICSWREGLLASSACRRIPTALFSTQFYIIIIIIIVICYYYCCCCVFLLFPLFSFLLLSIPFLPLPSSSPFFIKVSYMYSPGCLGAHYVVQLLISN